MGAQFTLIRIIQDIYSLILEPRGSKKSPFSASVLFEWKANTSQEGRWTGKELGITDGRQQENRQK
jgi:hypothetical protein